MDYNAMGMILKISVKEIRKLAIERTFHVQNY